MKYNDNGEIKELKVKVLDTVPVGSIMDYEGDTIPNGWVKDESTDDYSTEETFTGKYWIDGKKIYRKVLSIRYGGTNQWVDVNHNINNFCDLVHEESFYLHEGYRYLKIPNDFVIEIRVTSTVYSYYKTNQITANGYAILEYTKTTD